MSADESGWLERVDFNQHDRKIPQLEIHGRLGMWIGGFRSILADSMTYMAIANALLVAEVFYRGNPLVQSLFPTVWHFYGGYVVLGLSVFVVHLSVIYPQTQRFNNTQAQSNSRSPTHRQVNVNQALIMEMLEESDAVDDPERLREDLREQQLSGGDD